MTPRSTLIFAVVSMCLHWVALAPLPPRAARPRYAERERAEVWLVATSTPPAPQPTAAIATPQPESPRAERVTPAPRRAHPHPQPQPSQPPPPPDEEPPASEVTQPAPKPSFDAASISPLAVARSAIAGEVAVAPSETSANALTTQLRADAAERSVLQPRAAPHLKRRSDGGYSWESQAVRATIAPDGTVTFKDRPLLEFAGYAKPGDLEPSPSSAAALAPGRESRAPRSQGGLFFRFDLSDLIDRALGKQLYAAERRWFMQETALLRDRLALEHRLCSSPDQRALRGYLAETAHGDQLDVAATHDAIFAAFEACAGTAFGRAAVQTIYAFVRTHMPAGSPREFSAVERAQRAKAGDTGVAFDPYATE